MSGWAWAGIGCGTFIVLILAVVGVLSYLGVKKYHEFKADKELAVAELIIASHPDLEKVSSNPGRGEITIRSKSGEEYTVSYKEISQGRFSFKDASGNMTRLGGSDNFSEVPAWVPRPSAISGSPQVFHSTVGGKASGLYHTASTETIEALDAFYAANFGKSGFTSSSNWQTNMGTQQTKGRTYSTMDKEVSITLTKEGTAPVNIQVIYKEK